MTVAVGDPVSLGVPQWAQLMALVWEIEPDLIIELGRAAGNSTAAFLEAGSSLPRHRRIVSLCTSGTWARRTVPRLRQLGCDADWFAPLDARRGNIIGTDWAAVVGDAKRILVFWDAHGFAIAQEVLGSLLPLLAGREHIVAMHDMTDLRYSDSGDEFHGPVWNDRMTGVYLHLGNIESRVEQAITITDFAARNGLPLHSADESIDIEVVQQEERLTEMRRLGPLFSPRTDWLWFTLYEATKPLTFPLASMQRRVPLRTRAKAAARMLIFGA